MSPVDSRNEREAEREIELMEFRFKLVQTIKTDPSAGSVAVPPR